MASSPRAVLPCPGLASVTFGSTFEAATQPQGPPHRELPLRTTYITAIAIAIFVAVWLLSGKLGESDTADSGTLAERNARSSALADDRAPTRVRARIVQAQPKTANVVIRGRTENKRTVEVKTETSGRIVERPVEKGERVEVGQTLCRISIDDREARLTEARAAVEQARIEYEGSERLAKRGLISETVIATTKARLAATQAQLSQAELDIARTTVRAPFAGLVEDTFVEVGTFVQPGTPCATVLDLDPMLLVGRVPEREVKNVARGATAEGVLLSGESVEGSVTFVGKQSDSATRTYPVEVRVPNPDYRLRSGITTEIRVPVGTHPAHRINPSLLALDDEGHIGIRTLDADNRVEFHRVQIVADEAGQVWVTGLPETATVITVGQELVVPGEQVDVTFEARGELPAVVPPSEGAGSPASTGRLADDGKARVQHGADADTTLGTG